MTLRTALLIADGLALIGVLAFTVLAALYPEEPGYLVGQIISALVILLSVIWLRHIEQREG